MMKRGIPNSVKQMAMIGALAVVLAAGCATRIPPEHGFKVSTLRHWYVPAAGAIERKAVPYEHVEFLPEKVTSRKFRIIGYFVPTKWKLMGSTTDAIKAARAAGSLYGADAVYFDPQAFPNANKYTATVIVWE